MSGSGTRALTKFRIRYIRNNENRIVEIRQFDFKAKKGDNCQVVRVIRDPITKMIMSYSSYHHTVTQEDLDWMNG